MAKKDSMDAHKYRLQQEALKEKEQAKRKEALLKEEEVYVSIPAIYRKRLGKNLPLTVGVETISVPVDGQTYKIKKPFAEVMKRHLSQIDLEEIRSEGRWRGNQGNVYPTGPIPGKDS
ncbi:MAG: hypothetical protein EOM19_01460 [Candidatus Moranbacteria bacterium]|nr:hypothetical protein [Candidatus Moranbacteria bacterium]